jgi:16S rRNA (guanine966-N2)-methyltransferase
VRVVAGRAKGRKLVAPPGLATRPTGDRVRTAVFNALASLDAIRDADVLDLFAGSGALGIEALSRGARHCTFVDVSAAAIDAVRTNLAATGLAGDARMVQADAGAFLQGSSDRYDLALLDPPYSFERWPELLARLPAALAVIEAAREPDLPDGWDVLRSRRYGSTVVIFARRAAVS